MIEYVLIFALGFGAAALIALTVSPVIHRRIVTLTERRMRGTVALTSNEIRAEKDAATAHRAMENARLSVHLTSERHRRTALMAERERLGSQLKELHESRSELERHVERLAADGKTLHSQLGETENKLSETVVALASSHLLAETKDGHIEALTGRADYLATSLKSARADLTDRDAQLDRLQKDIAGLREARGALRDEIRRTTDKANELDIRLERESTRANDLDEKLAKSIAGKIDRESSLERSRAELERLRTDLAKALGETESMRTAFEEISAERNRLKTQLEAIRNVGALEKRSDRRIVTPMQKSKPDNAAISRRIERLRNRHNTLVKNLVEAHDDGDDEHLRDEIAEIAAMMIDLTAVREGPTSPINGILATAESTNGGDRPNLAERSRRYIEASRNDE